MSLQHAERVKWLIFILWQDNNALHAAKEQLLVQWGPIDFQGPDHPFDASQYYEDEMGKGLSRQLISFAQLGSPDQLAQAKRECIELENRSKVQGHRVVNLDIGYLDHNKVVLASIKAAGQKIYLGQGVYADLVLRFREGEYRPLEWTMNDLRDGRYSRDLHQVRSLYLKQDRSPVSFQ